MKKTILFMTMVMALVSLSAQSVEDIIENMERNRVFSGSETEGIMEIHDRFGTREIAFTSWSQGEDNSLIEFNNPAQRDQKILRLGDDVWLFFPEAEELIPIRGSARSDSVMGSDMSYEDLTGGKGLLDDYDVTLLDTEELNGNEVYKMEMVAKNRSVPYFRQVIWVDTSNFTTRKAELYARSGSLLKEILLLDIEQIGNIYVATRMRIEDKLRLNTYTEFILERIDINIRLDSNFFSIENLTF